MSFGTGPPAPPPLRKSRWSWWKPVKGTAAADEFYYNVHSESRPGSSSSSIKATSSRSTNKLRKARNSLTVLDDKRAEAIRKDLEEYMKECPPPATAAATITNLSDTRGRPQEPPPSARQPTGNGDDTGASTSDPGGSGVARAKNSRKSTSR
ncbi:hypothetical protein NKR19_g9634 [Coniochaeta hoffmannii]|uniref:Uncharacterized protein n=1 Tax=Coniochaeta hoffmannii TaxID=91930 RepID=A0AA38RGA0_9PEZI|nr:hypothetical protein NKR19_g9634 [Coniochaeta hoffmannii]